LTDVETTFELRSRIAQCFDVPATVRLGISLAAALLERPFEHPLLTLIAS
jgi:hypothetical protein